MTTPAQAVIDHFGLRNPPVDPFWIARQIGIVVRRCSEESWGKESDGTEFIHVKKDTPETRQRSMCAYALGCFLLGKRGESWADKATVGQFVVDLLAPSNWVLAYRRAGPDIALDEVFGVSPELMELRVRMLRY